MFEQKMDPQTNILSAFGDYQILENIGYGGLSTVYLAKNNRFPGQDLALKVYRLDMSSNSQSLSRFENCCQVAKKLSSNPSFPKFFEFGKFGSAVTDPMRLPLSIDNVDPKFYQAMERVEGKNLKEIINSGTISEEDKISLMHKFSLVYEKMHAQMIIHGDAKPANLMLKKDGSVVILDFDCSFEGIYQEHKGRKVIVNPKGAYDFGTLFYQAPETIKLYLGKGHTQFSDVWSLGVSFYRLLSGKLPFHANNNFDIIMKIRYDPCLSLTNYNIDPAISELVHWCLTKEWHKRPDATQLREGLEGIMRQRGIAIPSLETPK